MLRTSHLLIWVAGLSSCYDYSPIVPPQNFSKPLHSTEASSPQPQQSPNIEHVEQEAGDLAKACSNQYPDEPGHKADLVRCIVQGTDAAWDKAYPSGSKERHALGDYAVQLAVREDKGEITLQQAEDLYQTFLQKTATSSPTNH